MNFERLSGNGEVLNPLLVKGDRYMESSRSLYGERYVLVSGASSLEEARKAVVDYGFFRFTPLDEIPGLRENGGLIAYTQRRVFPEGYAETPTGGILESLANGYFSRLTMLSNMSNLKGLDLYHFLYALKEYALWGISLHPDTYNESISSSMTSRMTYENKNSLPPQRGDRGVDPERDRMALYFWAENPDASRALAQVHKGDEPLYIYKYDASPAAVRLPGASLPLSVPQGGIPYLGYRDAWVIQYISAIENMFAGDAVVRAVDQFFDMADHAKQTDLDVLEALYANDVNMLSSIDNILEAPVPVNISDPKGGGHISTVYTGIPGMLRDPDDDYRPYYPRERLKEHYTAAMTLVHDRLEDRIGMALYRASETHAPAPAVGTPDENIMLVVDVEESLKQNRIVYRDTSKNPNISYVKGTTVEVGTLADLQAYLKSFELRERYFRYPTGGLGISQRDALNLGLTEDNPLRKFGVLAALASAGAYFLASR